MVWCTVLILRHEVFMFENCVLGNNLLFDVVPGVIAHERRIAVGEAGLTVIYRYPTDYQ
jgi:hypothetical protein